jgi:uncharacterized protein (UPF0332 family)
MADAVAAELRRSSSALLAAKLLAREGLFDDAFSRLYYALYHASAALLLREGVEPRRHRALPGLVGRHFGDRFDAEEIALIARAATHRDLADYERSWHATQALFDKSLAELAPLLDKITALARDRLDGA